MTKEGENIIEAQDVGRNKNEKTHKYSVQKRVKEKE